MKKILEKFWWLIGVILIVVLIYIINKESNLKYITFATWGTLEEFENYKKLVDIYNARNPEYPVRFIHISGEYDQKMLIMAAGNNTPDVFKAYNGMLRNFYRNGIIENLSPYVKYDTSFHMSKFYNCLVNIGKIDSFQVGIPIVFSTLVLYYNKEHFDAANLAYPDSTWSYDKFLEVAKTLTKYNEKGEVIRYGCFLEPARPVMTRQWGGRQFNSSRDSSISASEEGAGAIQFFVDLIKKYQVMADPSMKGFRNEEIFSSERTSMLINGRWAAPWFVKNMKRGSFDVAPVPFKKKRITGLASHFLVMASSSKNKEAAWEFIKFLVDEESQTITCEDGNNIPVIKSIAESDVFLKNKNTPYINNKVFLDGLSYAVEWMFEESPYLNTMFMWRCYETVRDKTVAGELTALQALQEYDNHLNKVISVEKNRQIPKAFMGSALFFIILFSFIIILYLFLRKKFFKRPLNNHF